MYDFNTETKFAHNLLSIRILAFSMVWCTPAASPKQRSQMTVKVAIGDGDEEVTLSQAQLKAFGMVDEAGQLTEGEVQVTLNVVDAQVP